MPQAPSPLPLIFRPILISAAIAAFFCASLAAQQPATSTPPSSPAAAPAPTSSDEGSSAEMKPVKTELQDKLDSKSAKQGDPIVVKTTESFKTADGTEIPKGSKLTGHVMQVRPHSDTSPNSAIAVSFDQIEVKGGQSMPIHSMIQSVDAPGGTQQGSAEMSAPASPSPGGAAAAGGSRAGMASSGGTSSSAQAPTASAPQSAPSASGQGSGSVAGRVVAGTGPNAIRTTSIPNIYLASNAASPASGVLYSAKTDVHLDGGTQMVFEIATTASPSH